MQHFSDVTFLSDANDVDCDTGDSIFPIDIATFVISVLIVMDRNIYQLAVDVHNLTIIQYHSNNAAVLAPIVYE